MAPLTAKVEVLGFRELDAALADLPAAIAGRVVEDALKDAGGLIRNATAAKIHNRTGRTAADLRVEVQNDPAARQGVAAIGGTIAGPGARAYVLNWLEFGTGGHIVYGGRKDPRALRKTVRGLVRIGQAAAAQTLLRRVAAGDVRVRRALKLPGGIFRASAGKKKPIMMAPQSPMTNALAENSDAAIKILGARLWDGIAAYAASVKKGP